MNTLSIYGGIMKRHIRSNYPINDCFLIKSKPAHFPSRLSSELTNFFLHISFHLEKIPNKAVMRTYKFKTDKNEKGKLYIFRPKKNDSVLPCIFYIHGGAFVDANSASHKKIAAKYAIKHNCNVVMPVCASSYKRPYPAALNDALNVFDYIYSNASPLNIDRRRIVFFAKSSGACIASGITHILKDRANTPIKAQMLIYPVLDKDLKTASMKRYTDTPVWNAVENKKMWQLYAKTAQNEDEKYISPSAMESFKDLPEAYIETAEFDCLHDEAIEYARLLENDGIKVTLKQTYGTVHAFDHVMSDITKECLNTRDAFIRRMFK